MAIKDYLDTKEGHNERRDFARTLGVGPVDSNNKSVHTDMGTVHLRKKVILYRQFIIDMIEKNPEIGSEWMLFSKLNSELVK